MSNSAAPAALVCAVAIWEPSGLIKATLAPAPKAPRAGTTLILFTVVLLEPPPQAAIKAKGKAKHTSNLLNFILVWVSKI